MHAECKRNCVRTPCSWASARPNLTAGKFAGPKAQGVLDLVYVLWSMTWVVHGSYLCLVLNSIFDSVFSPGHRALTIAYLVRTWCVLGAYPVRTRCVLDGLSMRTTPFEIYYKSNGFCNIWSARILMRSLKPPEGQKFTSVFLVLLFPDLNCKFLQCG